MKTFLRVQAATMLLAASVHADPAITNVVLHPGEIAFAWESPTTRHFVASAASPASPYLRITPVLGTNLASVSNQANSSFFRVQQVTVVQIPDTNVAVAVLAAITNKADPSGEFFDFELPAVTNLAVVDRGITNLAGLEYAGLRRLNFSINNVTDLSPLRTQTNMTRLDLGDNQIASLGPLSNMTQLVVLEIRDNRVADLAPISGLTNLTSFSAWNNLISNITALAGLEKLTQLYLRDNSIEDITPLAGLTQLQELNLANNMVTNIDVLVGLTNLYLLYLTSNDVSEIGSLLTNAMNGGLGTGDVVYLRANPLSPAAKAGDIPAMSNLGVTVYYDP